MTLQRRNGIRSDNPATEEPRRRHCRALRQKECVYISSYKDSTKQRAKLVQDEYNVKRALYICSRSVL